MEPYSGSWQTLMNYADLSSIMHWTCLGPLVRLRPNAMLAFLRSVRRVLDLKQASILRPKQQMTLESSLQSLRTASSWQRPLSARMKRIYEVSVVLPRSEDGSLCLGLLRGPSRGTLRSILTGQLPAISKEESRFLCLPGETFMSTLGDVGTRKSSDWKHCIHVLKVYSKKGVARYLYPRLVSSSASSGLRYTVLIMSSSTPEDPSISQLIRQVARTLILSWQYSSTSGGTSNRIPTGLTTVT
jgi:hypothetical protein